ncbi:MAG: hypothetical protein E7088_05990 [Bacteroidales bacterium]|nr:hypothetical protein [Bacteroidales bacterium]
MKKNLFFYVVGVVALIAGAISCTNNDFEESIPQEQPKRTRAVRTMTADEVQARLDEIGEKYGTNINLLYVRDYSNLNEDIFKAIEQQITTGQTRTIDKMDGENLVDESSLDEYGIAMLSTEIEEESRYDDELNFDITFIDTLYTNRKYNLKWTMGIELVVVPERTSVKADFFEREFNSIPYEYTVDNFYHNIVKNDNGSVYFSFDFLITFNYIKEFIVEQVYGIYDDGFEILYSSGHNIIDVSMK